MKKLDAKSKIWVKNEKIIYLRTLNIYNALFIIGRTTRSP